MLLDFHTVILSFNHPEITQRCVNNVLSHRAPDTIHLIHNGSLPKFVDLHRKNYPQILHHVLEANRGFTGGTNFGLTEVFKKTPWILFLTNDCELLRIDTEFNLAPGFYAPLIFRRKTDTIDSHGGVFRPNKAHIYHLKDESQTAVVNSGFFYVPGTAFLMHREIFQKVGLFNEALGTYWEDVDYSMRVQKLKLPIGRSPQVRLKHGVGKTCHKDSYYTNYLFQRNRYCISRKYATHGIELRLLNSAVASMTKQVRRLKFQQAGIAWKAYRDSRALLSE